MTIHRSSTIAFVLALLILSCAPPSQLARSATQKEAAAEEISLEFWNGFNAHEVDTLNQMIEKYWVPSHPNIKIHAKGETSPEAILTAISGGTPPDVAILWDPSPVTLWARQGAILDLTPYIEKSKMDMDQFVPAAVAWTLYKGKYYALPFVDFNSGFYWNKTLFREAGLDPDRPPTTIAELEEYARKLTKVDDSGKIVQLGWMPASGLSAYIDLALSFGGRFYDPQTEDITANDPKNVDALTWDVNLAKEFGLSNVTSFTAGFAGGDNPFFMGKVAMTIDGCWQVAFIREYAPDLDYGVAPVPAADPAYAKSNDVETNPIVIPKGTKHPDEAWEFAQFLATDPNVSRDFSKLISNLPQLKSVMEGYSTDPKTQMFVDLSNSPNARAWAPLPVTAFYADELTNAVSQVFAGQAEPQAALDTVTKNTQAELDKYK